MSASSTDILRGELERHFELDAMKTLSADLLGFDPEDVGGTSGKGAFARALTEHCEGQDALQALADAILLSDKDAGDALESVYEAQRGAELEAGTEFQGYRILKRLGTGEGLGVVYLGEKKESDGEGGNGKSRRVAIKVIRLSLARNPSNVRRYLTAVRAVGHANISGVAGFAGAGVLDDGRPWVASNFVEGQTVSARLARVSQLHFNEARPILRGVLDALAAMHDKGLVHGDVKSENVFMARPTLEDGSRGDPTGLLVDAASHRLLAGGSIKAAAIGALRVFGDAKGIAPETARGGSIGAAADLYGVGIMIYEIITGRPPFVADTAFEVVAQHLSDQPQPPSEVAPRGWVTAELDAIVLKALAKDPADRYGSARELLEALEAGSRAAKTEEAAAAAEDLDESAYDAAVEAFEAAASDEELAAALEKVVAPANAWDKAVEVFTKALEGLEEAEAKKAVLFRVARIQESELSDHEAAEGTYREILELDEADDIALIALEELKRHSGDTEGLAELLLDKAQREEDGSERASILREIAQLYEEDLDDPGNAFIAWVQALADDPSDERTAREIERLAGDDADRWNDALSSLSEAVQEAHEPADGVALYVLMGRWYADHLKRPDFALPCYGQALQLDPRSAAAYDGTIELYRRTQSWQELVQILTTRATAAATPAAARDHKAAAAKITLDKLANADAAEDLYKEVLGDDPAHPAAIDGLSTIYGSKENWKELVHVLDKRAGNERGAAKVATLLKVAELHEDRLDDLEQAVVQYEAALAHDELNLAALKGLERLYARGSKYQELLANLEKQLTVVATPRQKIALLEQIGGIQEEEFVDHEKAVEAYEQVVEIDPGHEGANPALARLYRQLNRFDELVDTLDRHAKASEDDERKVSLLLQAVRTLTVDVGAPERAMSFCERVLAIDPEHNDALDQMSRLQAQTGDANAAVASVERLAEGEKDAEKKAELLVRAGRMLEDAGDKDRAIERFKSALDANANNVAAAGALRAIYKDRGDAHGAAELLAREVEITEGAISKAKLLAELGLLRRDRLEQPDKARDAYSQALELDGTCTPAARGLGDMAFDDKAWHEAVKYYEPLLSRTGDMVESEARELSVRCGDAFRAIEQFDKAQRAYLNAKAYAPDDRDVLERVADVTFESGEPDEAAELYRDIATKFKDQLQGGEKGHILYRQGESCRRAGEIEEAVGLLNDAAELMPEDPRPLAALLEVYKGKEEWDSVVRTHRRRMEHAEDAERFDLLVAVGDVLLEKLGDRQKAAKSYVAALEVTPDDRNLLTKLMAVYSETKDWSNLVEVILRIADLVESPPQLAKYYVTAASIAHEHLQRYDEAAEYYNQALENAPALGKAFEGLVRCLTQKEAWEDLAGAYRAQLERLPADAPAEARAALWDALGDLYKDEIDEIEEAVEAYEEAQALDHDSRKRVEMLAAIYTGTPKRFYRKAVEAHAQLLDKSPYRVESYQALRQLYTDVKKADESWCVCQVLRALKYADADEDSFFKKHRTRTPAAAQEFFTEDIWFNNVTHTSQDPLLTGIFAAITPAVASSASQGLAEFNVEPSNQCNPESDDAVMAQTLHYVSGVTQIDLPPVFYRQSDAGGLSFLFTDPPAIGLGQGALAGGPNQALAFVAGRHLAYFLPGHYLRHLVPTGSGLRAWLLAAIKSANPQFPIPKKLMPQVDKHFAALDSKLDAPSKDRLHSLVNKLLAAAPELDMKKWVAAVDLTADRVGFVLANDLEMSAAIIKASPDETVAQKERLKELYLYAASAPYLELRHKLGIAIDD